jgi:hypothetical protein
MKEEDDPQDDFFVPTTRATDLKKNGFKSRRVESRKELHNGFSE